MPSQSGQALPATGRSNDIIAEILSFILRKLRIAFSSSTRRIFFFFGIVSFNILIGTQNQLDFIREQKQIEWLANTIIGSIFNTSRAISGLRVNIIIALGKTRVPFQAHPTRLHRALARLAKRRPAFQLDKLIASAPLVVEIAS